LSDVEATDNASRPIPLIPASPPCWDTQRHAAVGMLDRDAQALLAQTPSADRSSARRRFVFASALRQTRSCRPPRHRAADAARHIDPAPLGIGRQPATRLCWRYRTNLAVIAAGDDSLTIVDAAHRMAAAWIRRATSRRRRRQSLALSSAPHDRGSPEEMPDLDCHPTAKRRTLFRDGSMEAPSPGRTAYHVVIQLRQTRCRRGSICSAIPLTDKERDGSPRFSRRPSYLADGRPPASM